MRTAAEWKKQLNEALAGARRLVVMGIGNVDRGDDGAGVYAAKRLLKGPGRESPRLKVILAHDVPENFTGQVRAFGADVVLVLDTAAGGFPPGTLHLVDPSRIANEDVSTHRTPLSALAKFLEETAGCRVVILGIEPRNLEPGATMTPRVRAAAAEAASFLAAFAARRPA